MDTLTRYMVKPFLILMLAGLGSLPGKGQELQDIISEGNRLYAEGEFEQAIATYESVVDSGFESAVLYYNLGNACFKSHKITSAILWYERALLLDPRDEDLAYNLELARTFVVDKIDVLPQLFFRQWHRSIVRFLGPDTWAIASIISFILFLLLFSLYLFSNVFMVKKISFWTGLLVLFFSVSSFVFAWHHKEIITNHDTAIVFAPSVTVKSSPDESGTDLFLIHEGTKVSIEDNLGEWDEIRLSDGNKGWLPASAIVPI